MITQKGEWLCTLTTGSGLEGQGGQHVVSTISSDQGRTWSPLVDIEPSSGPAASWVVPVVTPTGRVYVFYTYNGDNVKLGRDDVHGWYAMKYSDDHGKSWSPHRFRLPLRRTACDQLVKDGQLIQMFWGIDKPKIADGTLYFAFTKLGRYFLEEGEGWLFASSNFLSVTDPNDVQWQVRPVGDHGIRRASYGTTQEEHNLVPLGGERLYCVYRTTMGYPCHCYSEDGGRTWTVPEPMTYSPKGRVVRTPRACPKLWRCANGKYLFWYHFHGGPNYAGQYPQAGGLNFDGRNPAWIIGGIVKDGRLHWSQPEILLYDEDPQVRMSYPDLIEQDGRYWVTETQKSIARIHEIDAQLLQGTWAQLEETPPNDPVTSGCVVDWTAEELESTVSENAPRVTLDVENGFTLDLWLTIKHFIAGQVLLDTRDEAGRGWAVSAAEPIGLFCSSKLLATCVILGNYLSVFSALLNYWLLASLSAITYRHFLVLQIIGYLRHYRQLPIGFFCSSKLLATCVIIGNNLSVFSALLNYWLLASLSAITYRHFLVLQIIGYLRHYRQLPIGIFLYYKLLATCVIIGNYLSVFSALLNYWLLASLSAITYRSFLLF